MTAAAPAVPRMSAGTRKPPRFRIGSSEEGDQLERGRPAPPDRRVDHHHHAQPEVGRRQADDGGRTAHVVADVVLPDRGVDAHRYSDNQADDDGEKPQLEGHRHASENPLAHFPVVQQGSPQTAAQQDLAHPAPILHVDRLVQPQPALDRFAIHVLNAACEHHLLHHHVDDVARNKADRQEDQHRQDDEGRNRQQQTPDQIRSHLTRLKMGWRTRPATPRFALLSSRVERCRRAQNPISRFRS